MSQSATYELDPLDRVGMYDQSEIDHSDLRTLQSALGLTGSVDLAARLEIEAERCRMGGDDTLVMLTNSTALSLGLTIASVRWVRAHKLDDSTPVPSHDQLRSIADELLDIEFEPTAYPAADDATLSTLETIRTQIRDLAADESIPSKEDIITTREHLSALDYALDGLDSDDSTSVDDEEQSPA